MLYLETWNSLLIALGHVASGREAEVLLEQARRSFRELGVTAGERSAELGALVDALGRDESDRIRAVASSLEGKEQSQHRFLRAAEAVALASACARLQDLDRAEEYLVVAGSAIVGSPFLEVDWSLEFLRAQLALKRGEIRDARRHLHRCLHCRDLLTQLVPAGCRERFLAHRRFRELNKSASRLKLQPIAAPSTQRLRQSHVFDGMVGRCAAMQGVFQSIRRLCEQDLPVVIQGETGTGKDVAAASVHRRSLRAERPFVAVTCACLPNELFESEVFGHVAGAFTDAETDQPGLLETAEGGTVLLADVDQLSLECQAKLLHVLENRTFRKLGDSTLTRVDVRFLATTSGDLRALAERGLFREDLYYRLAGVDIRMPPLRERREDLPLLVTHFLEHHAQRLDRGVAKIEPEAVELLAAYDWPGNVRELETVLLRVLINLSPPETIAAADVASLLSRRTSSIFAREPELLERGLEDWKRELEREYLIRLFAEVRGDMNAMTERLGVKSSKLYNWLRDLGLSIRELRKGL